MVVLAVVLVACASLMAVPALPPVTSEAGARLEADLSYLASPALRGRLTGTPGNDSAAAFIARRYAELGMKGIFDDQSCSGRSDCGKSFLQPFRLSRPTLDRLDVSIRSTTQNVGGMVAGTDSTLRREYVVVGAHYDHLGPSNTYALDAGAFAMIHLGADDNASGTVAVLELARRLAQHPARRPVVFLNFSAEELGLIGSEFFVENSPIPISDMITMVNLDMVGRLRGNRLILFTGGADSRFRQIVDSVEKNPPAIDFRLVWESAGRERSDLMSFDDVHVPVISAFTDYHADYHRAGDIAARINFQGLEKVVDLTERVVRAVADGNARLY
jgi:hypothetical protein